MKKRYQIGFDEGVKCVLVDEYPDLIPIIDTYGISFGEVVGFAVDKCMAEQMVNAMNIKDALTSFIKH